MGYGGSCDGKFCFIYYIIWGFVGLGGSVCCCWCWCISPWLKRRRLRSRQSDLKKHGFNYNNCHESEQEDGTANYSVIEKLPKQPNIDRNNEAINISNDDYLSWNDEDVLQWIMSLNNGLFLEYKSVLKQKLKDENVTGSSLRNIYKVDIKFWGIKNMEHVQILHQKIQMLTS